jgi:hypothetical protein
MNFEQLKAILWLRWRLSRNQFARAGQLNAAISIIITALLVVGSFVSAVGGFLAGISPLGTKQPALLLFVFDGIVFAFLMFWLSGLMVEIQRSESIDLTRLLHLPISLRQVFVFNYAVSHASPSILLLLPGMLTFSLGLALRAGLLMIFLIPLVLAFVFSITAWTYCLRGWLAALMTNKRRRRAIILWVTVGFVLVSQLPNILVQSRVFRRPRGNQAADNRPVRASGEVPDGVLLGHQLFFPGWVGYGAMTLRQSNPWPALLATAACTLLGTVGVLRAYRMTLRFYQGVEEGGKPAVRPETSPATRNGTLLVERSLPWLAEDTAALTLATFRGLLRAPELKMAMIMPLLASVALMTVQLKRPTRVPAEPLGLLAVTGVCVAVMFVFAPLMSNLFGLDRDGFRALVLLPARRDKILRAKNLALCPFVIGVGLILLLLVCLFLRLPWTQFAGGVFQLFGAFLLAALGANLVSILAPYRLQSGTLQAKKPKPIVFLAAFAGMLGAPVLLLPVMFPAALQLLFSHLKWFPSLPIHLPASFAVLIVTALGYRALLPHEGRLLQRREQAILKDVTEHNE